RKPGPAALSPPARRIRRARQVGHREVEQGRARERHQGRIDRPCARGCAERNAMKGCVRLAQAAFGPPPVLVVETCVGSVAKPSTVTSKMMPPGSRYFL